MRLTKCQEHALMFLYFWDYFNQGREYWWSEDCQMKDITVRSMLRHKLFRTFWGQELNLTDEGAKIAHHKWVKQHDK